MTAPAQLEVGQCTRWAITPTHSHVGLAVKHLKFTTVRGQFTRFSGTIVEDLNDPTQSSVEVTIDAASISTNHPMRDDHLRSADFLDVAQYPAITFQSRRI